MLSSAGLVNSAADVLTGFVRVIDQSDQLIAFHSSKYGNSIVRKQIFDKLIARSTVPCTRPGVQKGMHITIQSNLQKNRRRTCTIAS